MQSAKPNAEPLRFVLSDGSSVEMLGTDGVQVVLSTAISAPPGSRLVLLYGASESLSVKVQRCKQLPDSNRFRVEGRWLDLSRERRTTLFGR